MNNKKSLLIIYLMVVSCFVLGCKKEESIKAIALVEPTSISVSTETATIGEISNIRVLEGYVIPYSEELTFKRQGEFLAYYVKIGDEVKKGDVLAELNDEPYINNIEQLKESIEVLKDKYSIKKNELEQEKIIKITYLDDLRVVSEDKSDSKMQEIVYEYEIKILDENMKLKKELYEAELNKLNDNLYEAKNSMNQHKILAPFDGKIVALSNLYEGNQVNKDTLIIGIVDPKDSRVTCGYLSEAEIKDSEEYYMFKNGKKYEISYLPYDREVYAALIMRKETPISTFLYQGDESDIRQGDYVLVCVVEDRKEDVLTIPVDTLYKDTNGEYVYQSMDGKKVKTYVITGVSDTMYVEIKEGLEEGDQVYVEN